MKYDIETLVSKVNEKIDESNADGRIKSLSVRRVRDYQTKEIISKPEKEGKNSYYTDKHLNELLNIRELQMSGATDSVLKNITSTSLNYGAYACSANTNSDDVNQSKILMALNTCRPVEHGEDLFKTNNPINPNLSAKEMLNQSVFSKHNKKLVKTQNVYEILDGVSLNISSDVDLSSDLKNAILKEIKNTLDNI
jgi:hypothetical protein